MACMKMVGLALLGAPEHRRPVGRDRTLSGNRYPGLLAFGRRGGQLRPLSFQARVAVYRMTMSDEGERAFGKQLERMAQRKG